MSHGLTVKQKAFADHYIKTGNATESYKKAGYKWSSEAVASSEGIKTLKKPRVTDYIRKRNARIDKAVFDKQVKAREELLRRIDSVKDIDFADNRVKDRQYIEFDEHGGEIKINEKTIPVTPNDVTRMLELLAKINGETGSDEGETYNVTIVNDIGDK